MLQNINISLPSTASIQPYLIPVKEFLGKTCSLIQLFPQKAQDLRIAYVSLAITSFVAYQIGQWTSEISNRLIPSDGNISGKWERLGASINFVVGVSSTLLVIKLFLDFAKLPISKERILCVCGVVLLFRAYLEARASIQEQTAATTN